MSRILHGDEWFEEIDSRGHYEREYEKIIQQEAERLFVGYHFIPFKTMVYSSEDADARVPDFALIHQSYRSWWVVEVELGHHAFSGHVLPQVRTLTRAKYGQPEVDYLCRSNPSLNRDKVIEMLKGEGPRVLVIVNAPVENWAAQLRPLGAKVAICQVFRSRFNRYILRLNGDYPYDNDEIITNCECPLLLRRMLEIHAPAQLPLRRNECTLLYYKGQASEWQRTDTGDKVYLHALRGHNLRPGKRYEIVRQSNGTLAIRPSTN